MEVVYKEKESDTEAIGKQSDVEGKESNVEFKMKSKLKAGKKRKLERKSECKRSLDAGEKMKNGDHYRRWDNYLKWIELTKPCSSDYYSRINPWLAKPPRSALIPSIRNEKMRQWAQLSLAHYEQRHKDVEFENVEVYRDQFVVMRETKGIPAGEYHHLYFKAMPKLTNLVVHVLPKLFFTEIYYNSSNGIRVITCSLLEPSDPGITLGCGICPRADEFPHPRAGYIVGHSQKKLLVTADWVRDIESGIIRGFREKPFVGCKLHGGLKAKLGLPAYQIAKHITKLDDETKQQWMELALAQYVKQHGAEFERVKFITYSSDHIMGSKGVRRGYYTHLFFEAMRKNVNCILDSPKFFFAEIYHIGPEIHVNTCSVLDPNNRGIRLGCGICPAFADFPHPPKGFIGGHFPYKLPLMEEGPWLVRFSGF